MRRELVPAKMVPAAMLERRILLVRGAKVMLDSDLAELYGVPTKVLNQAVKRNAARFPKDFMFRLRREEARAAAVLRSQIVTSKEGRGGRRWTAYVFTEQGVAMLSSVLHSERAIAVNIAIMRAFVRLRQILAENKELAVLFAALERKVRKNTADIQTISRLINELLEPRVELKKKRIGFPNGS